MPMTAVKNEERCEERDGNGVRCEKERDHDGGCACPEALARFRSARYGE